MGPDAMFDGVKRGSRNARGDAARVVLRAQRAARCGGSVSRSALDAMTSRGRCDRLLAQFAFSDDPRLRAEAAGRPGCPTPLSRLLRGDAVPSVRWASPTAGALTAMAVDVLSDVREVAAASPMCPPAVLAGLAGDTNYMVRACVAGNRSCPQLVLAGLACSDDLKTRRMVAAHGSITADVARMLADDPDDVVRWEVASNPQSPRRLLNRLAEHADDVTQVRVASNPSTSVKMLERFARFGGDWLHGALAENPACPPEILWMLASGECMHGATCAQGGDCRWEHEDYCEVLAGVLTNPSSPAELLSDLFDQMSNDPDLRRAAARAATDMYQLDQLAEDPDANVRMEVACNHNTSPQALAGLAAEASNEIRVEVAHNPNCPPEALHALIKPGNADTFAAAKNPNCPPDLLARAAAMHEKLLAAAHPNSPPDLLTKFVSDPEPGVRVAAAANAATPFEAIRGVETSNDAAILRGLARRALRQADDTNN